MKRRGDPDAQLIYKKYRGEGWWEAIDQVDFEHLTEWSGEFKKHTAMQLLREKRTVETRYAVFFLGNVRQVLQFDKSEDLVEVWIGDERVGFHEPGMEAVTTT